MTRLAHPAWLALLLLIPILLGVRQRLARRCAFPFTDAPLLARLPAGRGLWISRLVPIARGLALACVVVAMARPQRGLEQSIVRIEAVDIVLVLDVSTSMRALDFSTPTRRIDRLDAAKEVAKKFVARRPDDRIALIAFAALPYTMAPLTLDHDWLSRRIDELQTGMLEDGTAIGSALASAINRLRDSPARSRVIVLLTDGIHNMGTVTPDLAAGMAKALGIRVYTIGCASHEAAIYPVRDPFGREHFVRVPPDLDEETLRRVAETTNGRYFRATDLTELENIYAEIDRLEKTEIETERYTRFEERFMPWAWAALVALMVERLLQISPWGGVPE